MHDPHDHHGPHDHHDYGRHNDGWRRFAPWGPQWAGGPAGRAGVQLSYWYMQARDLMDERRGRRGR